MKNRILLTVLSLMVLTACNNQQEMGDTTGQMPVSAGVSGMISQEAASRMTNDTWEEEDAIGISGTSGDVTYTNRRHNFTGGSSFTPAPGASTISMRKNRSFSHIILILHRGTRCSKRT